jgi:hypothetical protein
MSPVKIAALGLVAAAALALWMCGTSERQAAFAYRWSVGQRLRYALSWTAQQTTRLPAGQLRAGSQGELSGRSEMALDLVLDTVSVEPGRAQVVARFDDLRAHRLELLGKAMLTSEKEAAAALTGPQAEALVTLASDGRVDELRFKDGSSDVFRALMAWVVTHTEVVVAPGEERAQWETEEPGVFGSGPVRYRRRALAVTRSRPRYERLTLVPNAGPSEAATARAEGAAQVQLDGRGFVAALESDERVHLGERLEAAARLSLVLRAVSQVNEPVALAAFGVALAPGQLPAASVSDDAALEQRIDGLTAAQLLADLARLGDGGRMPEHTRWLWRATGLLLRDPGLADRLVALVENGQVIGRGRLLIADLLASVGHEQAQAALTRRSRAPGAALRLRRPSDGGQRRGAGGALQRRQARGVGGAALLQRLCARIGGGAPVAVG